jgi:hypothetical protein
MSIDPDDVAALRGDDDLVDYLLSLTVAAPPEPAPAAAAAAAAPTEPSYHIPRRGAWPCGTAASGPTPAPCNDCQKGTAS